ncbi:MAG: hypothetical protein VKL58_03200 [Cyanobacteriota bacterium]|nr:hypothetical protein [Cyanobacteriota bacterium]
MSKEVVSPVPEFSFGLTAMACRRCGCRMLTKVGRASPMLICTDCGLPVDQRHTADLNRKHFWGGLTLMTLASMGGVLLLMATMNEMRTARRLQITSEAERAKAGRSHEGDKAYFHPGGVVQYR